MKNNRFLKVLAIAMSILMMLAIAVPAFAEAGAEEDAGTVLTPIPTPDDATWDKWDGSYDTTPFDAITDHAADQSNEEAIIIDTAEKLAGMAKYVNETAAIGGAPSGALKNRKVYITKNMDMMCLDFPIIAYHYSYAMVSFLLEGRLDGVEGKAITIANLSVPSSSGNNAGFIGTLRGGGVKNLTFVNAHVGNEQTAGGQAIVVGYMAKTAQFFENITVVDSTLTAGKSDSYTGYLVGVAKTDNDFVMKNCAVINCETITNDLCMYAGGLAGILQQQKSKGINISYTFENCSISGCTTTNGINLLGGFIAKAEYNENVDPMYIFKNCHYNYNLKHADDDLNLQGILIGDATAGAKVKIDGLLITGANDGSVDGATPLFAFSENVLTVDAKNIYSTVDVIGVGDTGLDATEVTVTKITKDDITGAAAATTLAGFDFENVWATRDGKIATLKIALADEYDAVLGEKHTHDYGTAWETDENNHWNECECGEKENVAAHADSDNDGKCDTCEYTMSTGTVTPPPVGGGDDTTTTTTKKDDEKKEDDGGCGSVVSATCLVTLLTVGMGVTVIRKKKD